MASKRAAQVDIEFRGLIGKLAGDVNGAVNILKGAESRINGIMKGVQTAFHAALVVGGVVAIKKLGDALVQLADKGDRAADIAQAFKDLGGSGSAIEQAKKSVLGVVDSFELMRIANEGLNRKIPNLNENFALMAEYGNKIADSMGISAKEGIEQVVSALGTMKEKQLAVLGITIDETKAYQEYGKALGMTAEQLKKAGDFLDENQKKEAKQLEGLKQLAIENAKRSELGESVTQANERLNASMEEGTAKIGIAINENKELTRVLNVFAEALDGIDWAQLGQSAANFFAILLKAANASLPVIIGLINDTVRGFDYLFGSSAQANADRLADKIVGLNSELSNLETTAKRNPFQNSKFGEWTGLKTDVGAEKERIQKEIGAATEEFKKFKTQIDESKAKTTEASDAIVKLGENAKTAGEKGTKGLKTGTVGLERQADAAKKAAEEMGKLRLKWEEAMKSLQEKDLGSQLDAAIDALDQATFDELKEKLRMSVYDGALDGWEEALKKGAINSQEAKQAAEAAAKFAADAYEKKMKEAVQRVKEAQERAYASGVDSIAGPLGDLLNQVSDGLGSAFSDIIGMLTDDMKSSLGSAIADIFGGAGDDIEGLFADISAGIKAVSTVVSSITGAKSQDKANKDNSGTGGAIGAGAGAIGGWIIGGPIGAAIGASIGKSIGSMIGSLFKWGSQNPETKARHAFANFIEDGFKKLKTIAFFDPISGKLKLNNAQTLDFKEGARDRFNKPGWADEVYKDMDKKTRAVFDGLGKGLTELLGITEDVGGQIGAILAENLSGNINNARLLVYQLGLSFEDIEKKLVEAGLSGKMSWQEVEAALQGVKEAFKPGVEGIGNIKTALDQLVGSGGRGSAAIKSLKDIAVEAMEAGAKSINELPALLAKNGASQEVIDAIMKGIRDRGIKTLEELANVSDRVGGGIIADIANSSKEMQKQWEDMTKNLDDVTRKLKELPEKVKSTVEITFTSKTDDQTQKNIDAVTVSTTGNVPSPSDTGSSAPTEKHAFGDIIKGVKKIDNHMFGENGMEAVMPVKRLPNGNLGVGADVQRWRGQSESPITLIVNGGEAGIEEKIFNMLRDLTPEIMEQVAHSIYEKVRREAA